MRGVYTPSLELQRTPLSQDAGRDICCDAVVYNPSNQLILNKHAILICILAVVVCIIIMPKIDASSYISHSLTSFSNIPNWRSKFCSLARHLADCVRSGDLKRMEVIDGTD